MFCEGTLLGHWTPSAVCGNWYDFAHKSGLHSRTAGDSVHDEGAMIADLNVWFSIFGTISCGIACLLLVFRLSISSRQRANQPPMLPYWIPCNSISHSLPFTMLTSHSSVRYWSVHMCMRLTENLRYISSIFNRTYHRFLPES
jgi:hypothetical protein